MPKPLLIPLFLLAFLPSVSAQLIEEPADDLTPKYVNEFLNIGVGARALGMSLSQVASVNDITSGYWNPAGLLGIRSDLEVAAMHS
ncbi:MAG: hypothetical protein JNM00_15455, partial [Flavobacteriales bacterium]|nr:hypothetical protein [Flavobacteriales bacterium]